MKLKYVLAVIIIAAVGYWAFSSFTGSLASYVSISEAKQRGSRVQVMGEIDHENTAYDPEAQTLTFTITDEDGNQMDIRFSGAMPGNFDQATHVVCLGKYASGSFEADQLLVKCPSKYEGQTREI